MNVFDVFETTPKDAEKNEFQYPSKQKYSNSRSILLKNKKSLKRLREDDDDLVSHSLAKEEFTNGDNEELDSKKTFTELEFEKDFIKNCKVNLKSFQMDALRWMIQLQNTCKKRTGGILADDPGMGKTIDCLAAIEYLLKYVKKDSIHLIITPLTVLNQWRDQCINLFQFPKSLIFVYHGVNRRESVEYFFKQKSEKPQIILTNYDTVIKDYSNMQDFKLKQKLKSFQDFEFVDSDSGVPFSFLFDQKWDQIFLDEAHIARNYQKNYFEACQKLQTNFLLCVTGTPIINSIKDIQTLASLSTPFCTLKIYDPINLREWKYKYLLRRLKKDYIELPNFQIHSVWIDLDEKESENYSNLEKAFSQVSESILTSLAKNSPDEILSHFVKLRQICLHPKMIALPSWMKNQNWECPEWTLQHLHLLNDVELSAKTRKLLELVKSFDPSEKIVIFSQFTNMLDIIQASLKKYANINCLNFDGRRRKGKFAKRDDAISLFLNDCNYNVLLISLKAGNIGLNLTKASKMIICDPWWALAVENQAYDRIYRIGQTKSVDIYRLLIRDSIEEDILQIQEMKKDLGEKFFEKPENLLLNQFWIDLVYKKTI